MARVLLDSAPRSLTGIPSSVLKVPMENKYQCQKCRHVLRKPMQAQCGHRFCVHCFKLLTSNGPKPCQACRQEEIYEEPQSILNSSEAFADNAAGREIASLPAKCLNEECSWCGTVKDYEANHENECEFDRVVCDACHMTILRRDKERHSERECEARTLNCKFCKVTFPFKEIKAHDEICIKFPLQCKDCGKKKIPREKMSDHARTCAKAKPGCPFSEVGCKTVIENGRTLGDHEQGSVMEHLRLLLAMVLSLLRPRPEAPGLSEWQEDSGLGLYRAPEEGGGAAAGHSVSLETKVVALENIVTVLNREVERTALSLEAASHQHRLDQDKIEALNTKVHQLERTLNTRELQLADNERVLRELQHCTYDGVFVWKISDFAKRRQDATAGRMPAMFSPAFYSSKYGYKMCLRLYLNGDGTGRGTHLSLFFVVMRGKCDALLKWPFSQKVTLMLLDQNNREHIIDAFRPDVSSTSFQRPVSEMNIASGCPLFCPLAKLTGKSSYLRDDTIFIKAIVDLTGL